MNTLIGSFYILKVFNFQNKNNSDYFSKFVQKAHPKMPNGPKFLWLPAEFDPKKLPVDFSLFKLEEFFNALLC